jgi:hypothetical protein
LITIEGEAPHRNLRIAAVLLSILLAWLTYKYIETPIRFGVLRKTVKPYAIGLTLCVVGSVSYFLGTVDLRQSHGYDDVLLKRPGFEHAFGNSLKWYKGKEDWLFLGNAYDNNVAKRRLAITPEDKEIDLLTRRFASLAKTASESETKVALLVAPNKSSVYPEYLPDNFLPSDKRYVTFFTDELVKIPNLIVHDPVDVLRQSKSSEGAVYYRTDTHWNSKGAYLSYASLLKRLGLKLPSVEFTLGGTRKGDLIHISKLTEFPLHPDSNWNFQLKEKGTLIREEAKNEPEDPFGWKGLVQNPAHLNEKTAWVIGDSFISALRPYLNATFKEVRYIGHRANKLDDLAAALRDAEAKPDLVIVLKVERSF